MRVQYSGLVIGGFEDGGASHGGFRGGDDGEVLARNTQKDLPRHRSELEIHEGNAALT